jgi:hypothetical protein
LLVLALGLCDPGLEKGYTRHGVYLPILWTPSLRSHTRRLDVEEGEKDVPLLIDKKKKGECPLFWEYY